MSLITDQWDSSLKGSNPLSWASKLATGSTGATSFTLTDSRGMSVTVNEMSTTRYLPPGTSASGIIDGAQVFVLGTLNSAGSVDASLIRLMK
jgi:hypothetical protein